MRQIRSPNRITMAHKKSKLRRQPAVESPPWTDLPVDITADILRRLGAIEMLESAQKVCTTWRDVCKEPATWRVIDMKFIGDIKDLRFNLQIMCRHAVDRSQGQLIDINIEYFGNDAFLHYISQRSSQLRCLRLACCHNVSGKGLGEAITEFPNLEELHLFNMSSIAPRDIESIGRSCPNLKSFTLNDEDLWFPVIEENNMLALAIAKNMHGLRHLKLFGNKMTDDGLQAILDGCPCLVSLDLRQCFKVLLKEDLGKRCLKQIQDLRHPGDSIDDYEWNSKFLSGSFNSFENLDDYIEFSDDEYLSQLFDDEYFWD